MMKKLSLKNAKSMLSRKEMKAISGGYDGYGNHCLTSACSVYDPATAMTHTGTCQGSSGNNIITCYCLTSLGDYNVGNSSGMSHCTA